MDRVPLRHRHAPHEASPRRGRPPHPHPRGPAEGAALHRQGHPHHPQGRRPEGRSHGGVRPHRDPGRRHPRDPPAPARASRRHQDRQRAQDAQHRAQGTEARARRRESAVGHDRGRDPGGRREVRRCPAHADRGRRLPVLVRTVPDEPVTITLSRNGWIRSRQGHGLDAAQFTYKAGDGPLAVLETRTIHPIVDPRYARSRVHDPRGRRARRTRRRQSRHDA